MDKDLMVKRFMKKERCTKREIEELIQRYEDIPLTLPITDEPMRRVCQVLTNHRYITLESCEGHGKDAPKIYLKCDRQPRLRHLAYIVGSHRMFAARHFRWFLEARSPDPIINSDVPLYHVLTAYDWSKMPIEPKRDYQKLLADVDIMGLEVLRYFSKR